MCYYVQNCLKHVRCLILQISYFKTGNQHKVTLAVSSFFPVGTDNTYTQHIVPDIVNYIIKTIFEVIL